MKREPLCLAEKEALEEERSWENDGLVVLTASVSLPRLAGKSRRARRFNRYYRSFCHAYWTYCEQTLLPEAKRRCEEAMATSAPWSVSRASLQARVTLNRPGLLSLYADAREDGGFVIRRADTWDLNEGLPLPLTAFFPPRSPSPRRRLIQTAREQVRRDPDAFLPDARAVLRRAFNARNYYLDESGLRFFYPMYSVAPPSRGIAVFTLPWDEERGPSPAPRRPERTKFENPLV